MDIKLMTDAGGTIEVADVAEVQIADGPIAPDFITKKIDESPDGVPITRTPINN